jgi:WD40 repeat protein
VGLDGNVYSGSYDTRIRVWSAHDGVHLRTLDGHTRGIFAIAMGHDGTVYSGSFDRTIRVWRGTDGVCMHTLMLDDVRFSGGVFALAVKSDGTLISGGGGITLHNNASDAELYTW